jgi:hypothetical protein
MKTKSFFAAAAIALSSISSFAAIHNLGTLGSGDTFLSGSDSTNIVVAKGSFADTFNFNVSAMSDVGVSAGVLNFFKFKITDATFSYTLFNSSNVALGSGTNVDNAFSLASLNIGSYRLAVTGNATGALGGQYNGALTVTPVPEPETVAMLLAGLGLMGSIARRRNKASA